MPSYAAQTRAADLTRCTFQPRNGRYFDRCRADAIVAEPANGDPLQYRNKRCQRHYDIDARTYRNRGWGWNPAERYTVPFDAKAETARILAEEAGREAERRDLFWATMAEAVGKHDIATVRELATRGIR